jgi:hypothetical protein
MNPAGAPDACDEERLQLEPRLDVAVGTAAPPVDLGVQRIEPLAHEVARDRGGAACRQLWWSKIGMRSVAARAANPNVTMKKRTIAGRRPATLKRP